MRKEISGGKEQILLSRGQLGPSGEGEGDGGGVPLGCPLLLPKAPHSHLCWGKMCSALLKKTAEVQTLRSNPSKGLILPCKVLNHWGAMEGTSHQGLRAAAADPTTEGE